MQSAKTIAPPRNSGILGAMNFIFSTGSLYSYSTARAIAFAARAGFDGIELMVDERWDTRQVEYLQPILAEYTMPVLAVHSPFRAVNGWPPEQPQLIEKSVTLAEALDAPVVIHHLPNRMEFGFARFGRFRWQWPIGATPSDQRYRQWLEREYQALQARTTVKLCIENMPARKWRGRKINRHHWNTVESITRFPRLTLDTTHLATWDLDPVTVYRQWGERVGHVHLSNYNGREHRRPEVGQLDLAAFITALVHGGYDGAVSLELHPDALGAGKEDDHVVTLMRDSLNYCRQWTASAQATVDQAAPSPRQSVGAA